MAERIAKGIRWPSTALLVSGALCGALGLACTGGLTDITGPARPGVDAGMDAGGTSNAAADGATTTSAPDSGTGPTGGGLGSNASGPDAGTGPSSGNGSTSNWGADAAMPPALAFATKVDLLFDIDNSASMGDKQAYLTQAIPDLVGRLLHPNCVDASGRPIDAAGNVISGPNDPPLQSTGDPPACAMGQLEFAPVHDMHLGIVTSSLGQRLSEVEGQSGPPPICDVTATVGALSAHTDDQGHLIARANHGGAEGPVADAVVAAYGPSNGAAEPRYEGFLDWFPTAANAGATNGTTVVSPVANASTLVSDFSAMVGGVGTFGCGIESQLESWYRFLVQPDPYLELAIDQNSANHSQRAYWNGVDTMLLQQRADFLRPDSLVAVVVLTDEDDSEIDVRSIGGQGYVFMGGGWAPYKGTSACVTDPASPSCLNCTENPSDPNCQPMTYTAVNDWGFDPNLRHVHMKQKYGLDPQYPWQRYVLGLTSQTVPDRFSEYPVQTTNGQNVTCGTDADCATSDGFVCVQSGAIRQCVASNYVFGVNDCTNPLFAASLPSGAALASPSRDTLCHLPFGPRRSNLVFYTLIGGVPHELLHFDPTSEQNSRLSQEDWVRILGAGPASTGLTDAPSYNYTGIDPHMIESYQDRTLLGTSAWKGPSFAVDSSKTGPLAPATGANVDPVNGREWTTDKLDPYGNYAPHVLPVDRQYACIFPLATPRDCSQAATSLSVAYSCDCPSTATGLTPDAVPPVCDPQTPSTQKFAKAYPTIRELQVARLMGSQGIVWSLCPIDSADNATASDPLYAYRPAVSLMANAMRSGLARP